MAQSELLRRHPPLGGRGATQYSVALCVSFFLSFTYCLYALTPLQLLTMKYLLILTLSLLPFLSSAQDRWKIQSDGSIKWEVRQDIPHYDHIEMSGEKVSTVLRYGVNDDGSFRLERSLVWPMLRTIPNNTHASLMQRYTIDYPSFLTVNGRTLQNEKVQSVSLNGTLVVLSECNSPGKVLLTRTVFPSTTRPMICERYQLRNNSDKPVTITVPEQKSLYMTDEKSGVEGSYTIETGILNSGVYNLAPGQELHFDTYIQAYSKTQTPVVPDIEQELNSRLAFVQQMWGNLIFESPDEQINKMFAFAKIRASESIYRTGGGLMHGPGGESYYAAIWANDQAEYVGPFFPYLGYKTGNEASLNAYRHFAKFMNAEYKPIPSSIIAEGKDIWDGAGDRGDAAMIAYGAARYALVRGDRAEAETLWTLIEWCLEYCRRKLNSDGVVTSDSDELEGRFPSGKANLCTSTLYYDALLSASYLGKDLKKPASLTAAYRKQAGVLHKAINNFFGATIDGYETYRYYDGNTVLRSWICMPLVVGINERTAGTIDALFSEKLWTKEGLLTQAGSETFWDRSTLYALRGVFAAGETEKAVNYLSYYAHQRLLGEHVPYAIEAWPEGSQRHLSAESGLFCRIVTEGIFGIRPSGLHSFTITPRLPQSWPAMSLKKIQAFNSDFDINVVREKGKIHVVITDLEKKVIVDKSIKEGSFLEVEIQ